jgi:hypothetical protein
MLNAEPVLLIELVAVPHLKLPVVYTKLLVSIYKPLFVLCTLFPNSIVPMVILPVPWAVIPPAATAQPFAPPRYPVSACKTPLTVSVLEAQVTLPLARENTPVSYM